MKTFRLFGPILLAFATSGCSLDASIVSLIPENIIQFSKTSSADITSGSRVNERTTSGYSVNASFDMQSGSFSSTTASGYKTKSSVLTAFEEGH
ncbi:MAG: hypothetical protein EOP06_18300 [Proteobacteria bacterium]|nr:MAG: hypothetical protein EOP06_18300 [Pseudomonadota bacterium]